jgi:hypothetical protein
MSRGTLSSKIGPKLLWKINEAFIEMYIHWTRIYSVLSPSLYMTVHFDTPNIRVLQEFHGNTYILAVFCEEVKEIDRETWLELWFCSSLFHPSKSQSSLAIYLVIKEGETEFFMVKQ